MAKDLSRNLPAKRYSVSSPTELRLSFEFTGSSTQFIDLAQALSIINRKAYSQQAYYFVSKIELYNNENAFVDIHTAPDTWVTRNAYRRGRALFERMNGLLDPAVSNASAGKYYDFKVYLSDRHRTTGTSSPEMYDINGVGYTHAADDWQYSQLISADDDNDGVQQADNFSLHLLGGHNGSAANWNSVGLIKSYAESRVTVNADDPNQSNIDVTDPLINLFDFSSEEMVNDVLTQLTGFNDEPPYDMDLYIGQGSSVDMAQQARLVTSDPAFGGRRIDQAPGFCVPFGLICVDPDSTTTSPFRIVVTLAPGTYHGVYAERV